MSTNENTATEKPDVYARVTSQIVNAIEQGVGIWKMPWHTSGRFCLIPNQCHEQETVSRHQYRLPVGRRRIEGLRLRRMGNLRAMAGTRGTGPQG